MASAERVRAYNGGLRPEPPAGSRGRAPGQRARGRSPPEAESFLRIGQPKEGANWPHICVLTERNCT